jgi:hypothetical protein
MVVCAGSYYLRSSPRQPHIASVMVALDLTPAQRDGAPPRVAPADGDSFALVLELPVRNDHTYMAQILDGNGRPVSGYGKVSVPVAASAVVVCQRAAFGPGTYRLSVAEFGPGGQATGRVFEFRFRV